MPAFDEEVDTRQEGAGSSAKTVALVDTRTPEQKAVDAGLGFVATTVLADLTGETVTPTAADDFFFYLENLPGSGKKMYVSRVFARSAAATEIVAHRGLAVGSTALASGHTPVTPANRSSSGFPPGPLCYCGHDPDLTTVTPTAQLGIISATTTPPTIVPVHFVLDPGQAIFFSSSVSTAIALGVEFYFE